MVGLEEFREKMKTEIEKTKQIKSVQVSGKNLDDALDQASLELGLPLRALEYEVLEKGNAGIFGIKGSPCRIIVYESVTNKVEQENKEFTDEFDSQTRGQDDVPIVRDANGRLAVRLAPDGAWIKIFPPIGEGVPIIIEDVTGKMHDRFIVDLDMEIIATAVEQADQLWIKAGEYSYNPSNSAVCSLDVTDDEIKVYITVTEPGTGGADLTVDDLKGFLANNRIVYGIDDDALQEFEDFPVFGTPFLIAEGIPPVHGVSARMTYHFETEPDKIHLQEREDGSVDFKELNKYQNVVKGQPLARKIPLEPGKTGRTVYGKDIAAQDGKDLEIGLGKNVTLIDNGSTVIATASGHVMLKSGKITVETVLVIPGSVDGKTGNVNAFGSVEIHGNVEDGYTVTAQGRIEVAGYVGKANLNAGGDIVVSRGINGGEGDEFGNITAGKSIWSSFIQNSQVRAGEFVIVSAGIVNSDVVSRRKVLCKGRRAKIVGGHVRASEEVNAVILGSAGGSLTLIEVGFDPVIKKEIETLSEQLSILGTDQGKITLNLQGMKKQVQIQRIRLSKEKEVLFKELRKQHSELHNKMEIIREEIHSKQEYLDSLHIQGKVSAARQVLTGVVLHIRDVEYVVQNPYKSPVTFILDNNYIRVVKFQDIDEKLIRR